MLIYAEGQRREFFHYITVPLTFFLRAGVPKLMIVGAEITIPAIEPSSKPRTFQRAVSS